MPSYTIDSDFPGGNIRIDELGEDVARIQPDLRDTVGDWFYWCFRVRGAAGQTLRFEFTRQSPVGARGPAISHDGGWTWRWLGRGDCTNDQFTHTFAAGDDEVLFSFGMTYTQRHLERLLGTLPGRAHLREGTLCTTRAGRPVELFRPGAETNPANRVLITARHHACEMMANYELEGILEAITADDDTGRWFRENVSLFIVPFVDKDGVEAGDQGKNRHPRDHNRDYSDTSVHVETAALRQQLPAWLDGHALDVMFDLHCPWKSGGINEILYQVGSPSPAIWAEQQRFGAILERLRRGTIPYSTSNDLPFGKDWNIGSTQGMTSGGHAREILRARLGTTLELPYANASGAPVTAESARALGHDIAAALREYLAG